MKRWLGKRDTTTNSAGQSLVRGYLRASAAALRSDSRYTRIARENALIQRAPVWRKNAIQYGFSRIPAQIKFSSTGFRRQPSAMNAVEPRVSPFIHGRLNRSRHGF